MLNSSVGPTESQITDYLDPRYYETLKQGTNTLHVQDQHRNIGKLLPDYRGMWVLDIGAGSGKYSIKLGEQAFVVATDFSPVAVQKVQTNIRNASSAVDVVSLQCQGEHTPFGDNAFDMVIALDFVEHISYRAYKLFLEDAYRVLKPGGVLCIYTPNRHYFLEYVYTFVMRKPWIAEHIGLLDAERLLAPTQSIGFEVDTFNTHPSYIPGFRLIERALMRLPSVGTLFTRRLAARLVKPA